MGAAHVEGKKPTILRISIVLLSWMMTRFWIMRDNQALHMGLQSDVEVKWADHFYYAEILPILPWRAVVISHIITWNVERIRIMGYDISWRICHIMQCSGNDSSKRYMHLVRSDHCLFFTSGYNTYLQRYDLSYESQILKNWWFNYSKMYSDF